MTRLVRIIAVIACGLADGPASADVFVLSGGGQVRGQLVNADEDPRSTYVIQTADGVRLTLSDGQIARVIEESAMLEKYYEFLPKVPNTSDGHWNMAERCLKAGLAEQREYHLEKVIEFDVNHREARHALGFNKVGEDWVRPEDVMLRQGYVRHKGSWQLAQEIALQTEREQWDRDENEWRVKVRRWRGWLLKGGSQRADALKQFREITQASATAALAELLEDRDDHPDLRMLYAEVLGRLRNNNSDAALLKAAMTDPDENVRDRCMDLLDERGTDRVVEVLVRGLTNKDNAMVNRSARALARLGNESAVLPLIDALTTKHKIVINRGGGNVNVGFGSNGVNGLSTGGGPRVEEHEVQNQQVLAALTALTPDGVNFGYNKDQWRAWYIDRQTPREVDLRRDQ